MLRVQAGQVYLQVVIDIVVENCLVQVISKK